MPTTKTRPDSLRLVRALVATLLACAFIGVMFTALFGFEEPNSTLLFLSAAFLMAAVVAVFAHVAFTGALTGLQRHVWLRQLTGRGAARAWGEYLNCEDLAAAATRFGGAAPPHDP